MDREVRRTTDTSEEYAVASAAAAQQVSEKTPRVISPEERAFWCEITLWTRNATIDR